MNVQFSLPMLLKVLIFVCGAVAVSSSHHGRRTEVDPVLSDNWAKEQGLANLLNGKIDSSNVTPSPTTSAPTDYPTKHPTTSPTLSPSDPPTRSPTLSPSESPTRNPTTSPTDQPSTSLQPSDQPSKHPTEHPSIAPSTSSWPTARPSIMPSLEPSEAPSVSQEPTLSPTSSPSFAPTYKPSSSPSFVPSGAPSLSPSTDPTQQPSQSTPPSHPPTETVIVASSIIINQSNTRSSTPLLIVGACCVVVMASTGIYLYNRGSQTRRNKRGNAPSVIEVSTGKDSNHGGGIISPYSIEDGLGMEHGQFNVNYTDSESRASDEGTLDYKYPTEGQKHFQRDDEMEDIDLETGRNGIDTVPNSVSIIRQTKACEDENNCLPSVREENDTHGHPRLRMPKSIYVPKIFQRGSKEGLDENNKQIITWNQIREEDRSPCSSGYAPASLPSPMLSPFLVKGLPSMLSPGIIGKRGDSVDEAGGRGGDTGVVSSLEDSKRNNRAAKKVKRNGVKTSPMKEIVVKREAPSDDVRSGLDKSTGEHCKNIDTEEQRSSKTLGSKSTDGSSVEWGIDVSKEQPSKASFEANCAELQNLLVSIKSLGSHEASTIGEGDVKMTYTEDSSEENLQAGDNMHGKSGRVSPNSDTSRVDDIDISPIESRSESSSVQSIELSPPAKQPVPGITFGRELLNSGRLSEDGTFNFRNILNDPKNDLYECQAPSGPLGIVVDTTPLGPRVRSLNPLSPIFAKISPGDVIVGVDEVDTVGMEAGQFWKVVSRKANQQERILTMLSI